MTSSESPPGLRERKNRRTQEAIVRATAELTLELGYASATIPRIAERADVAPRTVSTWFPAKDDILFATADAQIARGIEHLRGGRGDFVDGLVAWFTDEEARGRPDQEIALLRYEAIHHDPDLRARWRQRAERIQLEVMEAVARDTDTDAGAMGPALVAGAAMAFVEKLGSMSPEEFEAAGGERVVETGIAFLRAGLDSIRPPG